ncbi:MAG: HD domain-containing protein [Methylocystaceae bacterium]
MQETFAQIEQHLLNDEQPSTYLNALLKGGGLAEWPLNLLEDQVGVPQSPLHHPEGDVWNHTCMVVDEAAQRRSVSREPRVFMWAALLHDLGKPLTTRIRKNQRITAYDHDKEGEKLARQFLKAFTDDNSFIDQVAQLVRWHMQVLFVVKDLPFADIDTMLSQVELDEVALLSLCDRMGRGELDPEIAAREAENIRIFVEKCRQHVK